ncbi:MAG: hypothetical protein AAFW82_05205 [Pseudomonadota bacterium]
MTLPALFDPAPVHKKPSRHALSETEAIDIWIARWLRVPRKIIVARYSCDPRRLYEIWEGRKHPESRAKALERFQREYPGLLDRVDFSRHRRIPRNPTSKDQLALFDE